MAEGQQAKAPPLNGILGREIASMPGFDYSDAMKAEKGVWTRAKLDTFLIRPNHMLADTKMYFRGLEDAKDRARLIEWLAQSDVPSILPPNRVRHRSKPVDQAKHAEGLFRACTRCHSYTDGAPSKIGPNLYGLIGRPVASLPEFNYSSRIAARDGIWNAERLHIFFTEKKTFGQGIHLPFRMLKAKEDRETLIDFLKTLSNED